MRIHSVFCRALARLLIAVLLVQSAAAQQIGSHLPDLGNPAEGALSPAQEKRIAEEVLRELRFREPSYLDDPEVEEYLAALGARLTATPLTQAQNYRFFVLKDRSINAFAMPGGLIGLHSGLVVTTQTESELASVMSHEIGHLEQQHMSRMLSRQSNTTVMVLASLLLAVLAGRNSPNAAGAVLMGGQAAAIQNQLAYSRDYEREADRVGLQILNAAGFETQGMPDFFDRMYRHTRMVENNAPAYLRTHPLTLDRISDIESRVRQTGSKPRAESLEFALIRSKIELSQQGAPALIPVLLERKPGSVEQQAARLYGLARAYSAELQFAKATEALAGLRKLGLSSPILSRLVADLALAQGNFAEAARNCHDARQLNPGRRSLLYCEAEAWIAAGRAEEALKLVDPYLRVPGSDYRLYALQAKANTLLGRTTPAHRAQAEVYLLQGDFAAAIDQLQLAQRAGGGDYREQSALDARLREVRKLLNENMKDR